MPTINSVPGNYNARLLGIGAYRPSRLVTNEEICKLIDSSDEWIYERSGIRTRRFATKDENLRFMAAEAGRRAIENSGVPLDKINAVILASSTWSTYVPHGAPTIAEDIGLTNPAAMDIAAGCAGFGHALALADSLIRSGNSENILVIGGERMSECLDMTNRSNCFLFGDGAGAVVVGRSDINGISPTVWGSDGKSADAIRQTVDFVDFMEQVEKTTEPVKRPTLHMDGQKVFKWAAFRLGGALEETLSRAGLTPNDIDAFIPHQANGRINELMYRKLGFREGTPLANDIEFTGNTSAASIPLAMEELLSSGKAKGGDLALCLGFGSGLTYAGQVVILPPAPQKSSLEEANERA